MIAEENDRIGDFSFTYGKEDVRDCLIDTEKELRNAIDLVLKEKFGLGWETNPIVGFNTEQQERLRHRQVEETRRMHSHGNKGRLIDYTYLQDLAGLIYKHWENVFSGLFPWSIRTAEYMFGVLLNYRDVYMHGRDEDVPTHRKYLCLGVCGEILHAISDWYIGFRPTDEISSYECHLFISVSKEDPECEFKARSLTDQWINSIASKPKEKLNDDGRFEKWLIRLTEGSIKLTIDKRLNQMSELETGQELKYRCGIDVTLETDSVQALDKAIVNGRHPYWDLKMVIKSRFDMEKIKSNAEYIGRHVKVSGGWSRERGSRISSIGFALFRGYGDTQFPVPVYVIDAIIHSGASESGSSIELTYHTGVMTEGFYQAHKFLLPNKVLSILYNRVKGYDLRQLVSAALSLPPAI